MDILLEFYSIYCSSHEWFFCYFFFIRLCLAGDWRKNTVCLSFFQFLFALEISQISEPVAIFAVFISVQFFCSRTSVVYRFWTMEIIKQINQKKRRKKWHIHYTFCTTNRSRAILFLYVFSVPRPTIHTQIVLYTNFVFFFYFYSLVRRQCEQIASTQCNA